MPKMKLIGIPPVELNPAMLEAIHNVLVEVANTKIKGAVEKSPLTVVATPVSQAQLQKQLAAGPVQVNMAGQTKTMSAKVSKGGSQTQAEMIMHPFNPRGGITAPHVHIGDKVYLLNEAQWAIFTKKVIEDCTAKLAKANKLDFQTGVMLAGVSQALSR